MPGEPLSILTITTAFPNPVEPGHSPFVAARLQALAEYARIRVIAPVPLIDYSNPNRNIWASRAIPRSHKDGPLEVFHPRWLFPPLGTPVNIPCLAARVLPLARELHRRAPVDWIDSHFGYPDGVAAALIAGALRVPFSITLRGNELVNSRHRIRRGALAWAFRRATRIIAVSDELRGFAVSLGVAAPRAVTIPNGVDGKRFYAHDRAAARAGLGLSSSDRMILSAGGLGPGKGHHLLVQAMPVLLQSHPDLQLWIAGGVNRDGRYENEIRALIGGLGLDNSVRLLGPQAPEHLAGLMSAADVFSLASFAEGWPNVVQEALACGAPVVATRVGAIPQMIATADLGFIVPPGDVPALAAALDKALGCSWDRAAISLRGRSRSWQQAAREVSTLIADALQSLRP